MALDIELYRRTVFVPSTKQGQPSRRIGVIDIQPEGATQTMVLVHGFGGDATQWLYQLRFFGKTMRVIAPELRGHGRSDDDPRVPYTMEGLVDDLESVLAAMQVDESFMLIAHSFGGAVATEYTLRHPEHVKGLVLIGVPSRFVVQPALIRLIRTFYALHIPESLFDTIAKRVGAVLYAPLKTLKPMHDLIMSVWNGSERLAHLNVPSLVVLGHRDTVFLRSYYEDVPRIIPHAQQIVIAVSAHLVQLERPDAVNRAIRRFAEAVGVKEARVEVKQGASGSQALPQIAHTSISGPLSSSSNGAISRFIEKPWLQHYDDEVPEQLPVPRQSLHHLLSNSAKAYPHRPALIFFGQQMSYQELDRLSNRLARAFLELGVQRGERVAIVLPNVPQCVIAFYATLRAGAVVVVGSPLSSVDEIRHQVRDAGASVLVTLTSYHSLVEQVCQGTEIRHVIYTDVREYLPMRERVRIASLIEGAMPHKEPLPTRSSSMTWREHTFQQLLRRHSPVYLSDETTSEQLALIQYTSGTTDTPKGVMLSHGNLVMNVAQVRHWMPEAQHGRERMLCVLPLSHIYGITTAMNTAICLSASLILLTSDRIEQLMHTIKEQRPTMFPGVPSLYLAVANYPKVRSYGVSTIRTCISGSASLPVEVQEAFEKLTKGYLVEAYGLTEASPGTHSNPLRGERRVGSIGLPMSSTLARIVDVQTGAPLPPQEVGELLIRGPQVMQGYWNMPHETAQALRDGWLHTGDLARMDEDGFFTIIDRKKDLILSGSYNVYPRDVEEVLYEHPKVLEAAVVNTGGTKVTPYIKAFVVLKRGERATPDELLALCRERLDSYKVPRQIEFRTELPKNMVGKILRRLLVETA